MPSNLEEKIGDLAGQIKTLAPTLEILRERIDETRDCTVKNTEGIKQLWHEVATLSKKMESGGNRWWSIFLILLSAIIGAVVSFLLKGKL